MSNKTVREAASRLLANSNVLAMVSELKTRHADRHNVTVDLLTKMLLEEREIAHQRGNTAVEAVMGLAKLPGFVGERADLLMQNGEPAQPVIILTIGGEKTTSLTATYKEFGVTDLRRNAHNKISRAWT